MIPMMEVVLEEEEQFRPIEQKQKPKQEKPREMEIMMKKKKELK